MKTCDFTLREFGRRCKSGQQATQIARVRYNPREQDVFYLCEACAKQMTEDIRKTNSEISVRPFAA
jgi:hypothetical protein